MSLIIRGGKVENANQSFTANFFCEDGVIHIDRLFYALYYGAIEKRSAATADCAVDR
tara:strand:+ start:270 stop:440 length:171 start_codon:yes stop_codon:yes gene_type:complete